MVTMVMFPSPLGERSMFIELQGYRASYFNVSVPSRGKVNVHRSFSGAGDLFQKKFPSPLGERSMFMSKFNRLSLDLNVSVPSRGKVNVHNYLCIEERRKPTRFRPLSGKGQCSSQKMYMRINIDTI